MIIWEVTRTMKQKLKTYVKALTREEAVALANAEFENADAEEIEVTDKLVKVTKQNDD